MVACSSRQSTIDSASHMNARSPLASNSKDLLCDCQPFPHMSLKTEGIIFKSTLE